jgi:pyruvate dehydrogenase E1 component
MIAQWMPRRVACLGTDGFGRSESRDALRDFFEVDARHIAFTALVELYREKQVDTKLIERAAKELGINPGKLNPHTD